MLDDRDRDEYWALVKSCLEAFHQYSTERASATARELRELYDPKLGNPSSEPMIYHEEPFELACRITGTDLDLSDHITQYEALARDAELRTEQNQTAFVAERKPAEYIAYTREQMLEVFEQAFAFYYETGARIDIETAPNLDKLVYRKVIDSVLQIGSELETKAPFFRAPSPFAAALFLADLQTKSASFKEGEKLPTTGVFQSKVSKLVFRSYTADSAAFRPALLMLDRATQIRQRRELAAFSFLWKQISEYHVPSVSLHAYLAQSLAFDRGMPTELIDWTTDANVAVAFAQCDARNGDNATVFCNSFGSLQKPLLPSPFAKSAFSTRRFFTGMNETENEKVFAMCTRISYPADSTFRIPPHYMVYAPGTPEFLDELIDKTASVASLAAERYAAQLDALESNEFFRRSIAVENLRREWTETSSALASQFPLTRNEWIVLVDSWLVEIDRYIEDLALFYSAEKGSFMSMEALHSLVGLNRDALHLYCKFLLEYAKPSVEQIVQRIKEVQKWLFAAHPELHKRELRFEAPHGSAPSYTDIKEVISKHPPRIILPESLAKQRTVMISEDFARL